MPFRLSELRTPPFYALVKSCGFTLCSTDGVVVNDDSQPLREDGTGWAARIFSAMVMGRVKGSSFTQRKPY